MRTKRSNWIRRFVSILIIFAMILMNWIPIISNIVYAAEEPTDKVEVKGYFSGEGFEDTDSLICDVSDETIRINFEVSVKGEGYFKSGVLKFDNNLNFDLNPDTEMVIKNNSVKLPEVSNSANLKFSIPISFKEQENFTLEDLSRTNKIILKGEYVDNEGILYTVEKTLNFNLSWKEEISSNISSEVIKNLEFEKDGVKGKILQTKVKVFSDKINKLPIKATKLMIDIPKTEGLEFTNVTVDVDKLLYTQGREDFSTDFTSANYSVEDGKVLIDIENIAIDETISRGTGEDSYILTFVYSGEMNSEVESVSSKIVANVTNYGDEQESVDKEVVYNLKESVGDAAIYLRENKETPISKGYLLADSFQEKYEITYTKKDILSVSRADLVSGLEIDDVDEYFVDENGDYAYLIDENSFYKRTEFSKENLINVLGEDGKVEILNISNEVIATITFDMETDENDSFFVDYEVEVPYIKIRFSDPIADGNISVVNTKSIRSLSYSREEIKNFDRLISHAQAFAIYNEGITTDLGIAESSIEISKTSSGATIEVDNPSLSTTSVNEGVNFKLRLNNNEDSSDLYENPVFEIRLPEVVKEVNVRNIDMFYANGELEIANVENLVDGGNQVVRITLTGTQTSYGFNKETNGTVISLDLDLSLDEFSMNGSGNVELYYYNASATNYDNEVAWLLAAVNDSGKELMNGSSKFEITYTAPTGLVNAQATETKETTNIDEEGQVEDSSKEDEDEQSGNRVVSSKQGPQSDLLEEGVDAKLATMYISVMNNTNKAYYDFKILGRIPFVGNKDILTGEDLGTTVDTILDTEIIGDSALPYTVYYSENPEATEDLYDSNNNWKMDFYKMGGVKSYLIVFDDGYVFEPETKLEFEYDYVIPANLEAGDAFYGTYASYFTEQTTNLSSNNSADKVGYETLAEAEIEATMSFKNDIATELSDAEVEINIKNTTNVDIENVVCDIPVVNGLLASYVNYDGECTFEDRGTYARITFDKISGNSENILTIGFTTFKMESTVNTIKLKASISGDNLDMLNIESNEVAIQEKNFLIEEYGIYDNKFAENSTQCSINVVNISGENLTNFEMRKTFSNRINITDVSFEDCDGLEYDYSYDKSTGLLIISFKELREGSRFLFKYTVNVDYSSLTGNEYTIDSITSIKSDDANKDIEYKNNVKFKLWDLNINLVNPEKTGFVSEGAEIEYVYDIKNNSDVDLMGLSLMLETTENLDVDVLQIVRENGETEQRGNVSELDNAIYVSLKAGESIKVLAKGNLADSSEENVASILKAKINDKVFSSQKKYSVIEDTSEEGYKLTGETYIDFNKNLKHDEDEEVLSGLIVDLYDVNTNKRVTSTITDVSGRYMFTDLENGDYYINFNFDDTKYMLGTKDINSLISTKSEVININDNYVTDNININDSSISNINLSLTDENIFDLKLDARVEKMTIQNSAENSEFINENIDLAKVDINPKLVAGSKVLLEYKIVITNQGTIDGTVKSIVDYMPSDLEFNTELNPDWYEDSDGNIYTRVLKDRVIQPGESIELKLILVKNMNSENTGLVHNSFEIAESSNDRGLADIDSKAGNKLDEDDLSNADAIIGITTGVNSLLIPIVLVSIIVLIPVTFLIWKKIEERRYV